MKFFERHRWPTFEGIMMILIVVISVFSFAFITADNKVSLFSGGNSITGNMVKVTGMDTASPPSGAQWYLKDKESSNEIVYYKMESTQLKFYDRGTWADSKYRTIQLAAKDIGSSSHYIIIKSKTIWTSKNTYVGIDSTSSSSSSSTAGTTKYITVDGITYKLTTNNPDSITPNFVKDGVIYQNGIAIGRTLSAATQLSSAEIDSLSIGSDGKIKKGGNIIGYRTPTSGAVAGTPGSAQSTSQLIPTTDPSGRITGYNKVTTNTDGSTISTPNFIYNNDIYIKGQKISVQNTAGLTDDDLKNVKSYKDGVFTLSSSSTTPLGQADATSFKLSGESIVYQKGTGVIAKVTSIKDPAGKILGRVESPGPASTSTDSKFKMSDSAITITIPKVYESDAIAKLKEGYVLSASGSDAVLTKTDNPADGSASTITTITLKTDGSKQTVVTKDSKTISDEKITKDPKTGKETGREKTTYYDDGKNTQTWTKKSDYGTTTLNYDKESNPTSGIFETLTGKIKLSNTGVLKGINENKADPAQGITQEMLFLAKSIDDSTSWFSPSKSITDSGWEVHKMYGGCVLSKYELTTKSATIKKGLSLNPLPQGITCIGDCNHAWANVGNSIYVSSKNGYTYYDTKHKTTTQEFLTTTTIGSTGAEVTMRRGDYARTDTDGTLLYQSGNLNGVFVKDNPTATTGKAYKISDMYNDDGTIKSEFADETHTDLGVKFIREEFGSLISGEGKLEFRSFFGRRLSSAYESAQGGRALSTLFGMEDNAWRKAMDNFFATNVIGQAISGKWEDSICHFYIPKDSDSVLNFNMPGGIVGTGAHIEGERAELVYPNGTIEYLYKITYGIKNPITDASGHESDSINYNVYLYGSRTVKLFSGDREVEPGDEVRGMGSNEGAIPPRYSASSYTRVCIKFRDDITTASGKEASEVCSPISSYSGSPSSYGSSDSGGSSGGGEGGSGGINDY